MISFEHIREIFSPINRLKMKSLRLYHIFVILINKISSKPFEEHSDQWKGINIPDESKIYEYSNFGYGSISYYFYFLKTLIDTGENVQKWTRVFSTRHWVILVARMRRKKEEENSVSTFGRFRLWTSFEASPVSVK